ADPLAREPGLAPADAAAIRRVVLAAADREAFGPALWPRPLFLATTIAATVIVGVLVGRSRPWPATPSVRPTVAAGASAVSDPAARRQLQFATPGGTRIIWVFDPDFTP